MNNNLQLPNNYNQTLEELKYIFKLSQGKAIRAVNKNLIDMYWNYGKIICERQEVSNWGDGIIKKLSIDLSTEFEGVSGLSERNLLRMKTFYYVHSKNTISPSLLAELSWTHHTILLEKCKNFDEQVFYIQKSIEEGWSTRKLEKKIKDNEFNNLANNQTNFGKLLKPNDLAIAKNTVKDDYNLDFLSMYNDHKEKELEDGLVRNIIAFLDEMGGYFAFIGRQKRLELDGKEYFVDLLFYHRVLKRLVVVELKTGEFQSEYAGKMQLYLNLVDEQLRQEGEEESIGIIICRDKHRATVEYTLKDVNRPIGVATYTYNELPEIISKYLPSEDEINKLN
jgi:predicted nuclease of restriction endonuclease-like (RecB) superfamily